MQLDLGNFRRVSSSLLKIKDLIKSFTLSTKNLMSLFTIKPIDDNSPNVLKMKEYIYNGSQSINDYQKWNEFVELNEKIKEMETKTGMKAESEKITELITLKDYFARFYEIRNTVETNYEAYKLLENEYLEKYGRENYSTYGGFMNAKGRWIKSRGKWDRFKSTK
jgi:hypothetical protein